MMKIKNGVLSVVMFMFIFGIETNAKVDYMEPDGENGYYVSSPEITIKHSGEEIMRYRLEDANGKVLTGRLDSMMRNVTIQKGILKDGKNILDIWTESENGTLLESSMETYKFLVDQTPPLHPLTFTKSDVIEIFAEDDVSGVAGIYYAVEGQETQYLKGDNVFFALPKEFEGTISAYAVDVAGNKSEMSYFEIKKEEEEKIFIPEQAEDDREKPSIAISGIPESAIANQPVHIICTITDNQQIAELKGQLTQSLTDGTEILNGIEEWKRTETGYQFQRELTEDGIYQIEILGKDAAGNKTEIKRQVIVDQTAPVIDIGDVIIGEKMKEFKWDYQMDEMISDLTSWHSEIQLDGILYKAGQTCSVPGKHMLKIRARDLAGNESEKIVEFYIEKPLVENDVLETENERKEEEFFYVKQEETIKPEIEIMTEEKGKDSVIIPVVAGIVLITAISLGGILMKKKIPIFAP